MFDGTLDSTIDMERHPIDDVGYQARCRSEFDAAGVLVLEHFIQPETMNVLVAEAEAHRDLAFFSDRLHTVYLLPPEEAFGPDDARSHAIVSTKGAVTTDQVPQDSPLRTIYDAPRFQQFLCAVLDKDALHQYADPLSSININYYYPGQELGWHFDNSEFSVTLLLQRATAGGAFEFIDHLRDSDNGDDNEAEVAAVLAGGGKTATRQAETLVVEAGALVLFRGRDALHRVTPVEGDRTRLLVVFAYNTQPGMSLSESARLTFFGRLG